MTWNVTNIGWTDITWGVYHGCAKTSEGCKSCYAEELSNRMGWTPEDWTIINLDDNFYVRPKDLVEPRAHPEPRWVWGASMSDPWVPAVSVPILMAQLGVMYEQDQHYYLLLTKWGPDRDRSAEFADAAVPPLPAHIGLGVTVESQRRTYRLDWLREQQAEMKFVSFEPLLEPVIPDLSGIDWAIIGGESGDNRREWNEEWAKCLIAECWAQDTAPFFKQHGHRFPEPAAEERPHERTTIDMQDGQGRREIREFPEVPDSVPAAPQEYLDEKVIV